MEALLCFVVIPLLFGIITYFLTKPYYEQKKKEEQEKKRMNEERRKKEYEQKEREWQNILAEREKTFGKLTKRIAFALIEKNNIFVYEEAKVIYIDGHRYNFTDILSCRNEFKRIEGKEISRTTIPDKYEMAANKLLWGMDKSYNVKTRTKIVRTPDREYNTVYIGINSISNPQITLHLGDHTNKANEICAMLNVIINSNNKSE